MTLYRKMLFFIAFLCVAQSPCAFAADILKQIHPYISLSGEYNDNIGLTDTDKEDDFIATVQPGISFSNMDARSGIELNASAGFVFYNKNSNLNYISGLGSLNAKYMNAAHFNFYLRDAFLRSENPREQEYFTETADNKFVLALSRNRNVYWRNVFSPTVEYQFGEESKAGVNYRHNIYQTESSLSDDSVENYINPFIDFWFDKRNGLHVDYAYTSGDFESTPDLNGHKVIARYMNRFNQKFTVFIEGSYTNRSFSSSFLDYDIYEPSVGLKYNFTPSVTSSLQIGYYRADFSKQDQTYDGVTFKADLSGKDVRTMYVLSVQGGYTEDYFTAQNLGFQRYYRATGSITHHLDKKFSIGMLGSIERVDFVGMDRLDTIWGLGAQASYKPLSWLTLSLEVNHNADESDRPEDEYIENRGILKIIASY